MALNKNVEAFIIHIVSIHLKFKIINTQLKKL